MELELFAVLIQSVLSECLRPLILPGKLDSLQIGVRVPVAEESLFDAGEDPRENPKDPATEDKKPDRTPVGAAVDVRVDEDVVVEKVDELIGVVVGVGVKGDSIDVPSADLLGP